MMVPVSSPMRHSEIRVGRILLREDEEKEGLVVPFCKTVSDVKTVATRVWPLVPGFIWSTFVKTGFLLTGLLLLFPSSLTFFDAIDLIFPTNNNNYNYKQSTRNNLFLLSSLFKHNHYHTTISPLLNRLWFFIYLFIYWPLHFSNPIEGTFIPCISLIIVIINFGYWFHIRRFRLHARLFI